MESTEDLKKGRRKRTGYNESHRPENLVEGEKQLEGNVKYDEICSLVSSLTWGTGRGEKNNGATSGYQYMRGERQLFFVGWVFL